MWLFVSSPVLLRLESDAQRLPDMSDFFLAALPGFGKGGLSKQLIVGRHDVLDG